MTTSSARSSIRRGARSKIMAEKTCGCGDVRKICVSRTDDNPGRRFWGCPNYQDPEMYCGYFKWVDEECIGDSSQVVDNNSSNNRHMEALLQIIVGLLMAIVIFLVLLLVK